MADQPAVRPIGSERFVDWGQWVDGLEHVLWRGPRSEGYDFEQDVEQARGAFLSYASRRGLVTHTEIDYTDGEWILIQARPRQDAPQRRRSGKRTTTTPQQAKSNAVTRSSTAGA